MRSCRIVFGRCSVLCVGLGRPATRRAFPCRRRPGRPRGGIPPRAGNRGAPAAGAGGEAMTQLRQGFGGQDGGQPSLLGPPTCARLALAGLPAEAPPRSGGAKTGGRNWIRTSVGRSPADLQSALVGHLSILPSKEGGTSPLHPPTALQQNRPAGHRRELRRLPRLGRVTAARLRTVELVRFLIGSHALRTVSGGP